MADEGRADVGATLELAGGAMGWSWRRSASIGPVRLNFSQSGVGVSVGVKGARISTGPRGTYVHLGAGGFRYSQRLDGPASRPRPPAASRPAPLASAGMGREVENIEPARLVETSADDLLEEIRRKQSQVSLVVLAVTVALAGSGAFAVAVLGEGPAVALWGTLAVGLIGLVAIPWAAWWDRRSRMVHVRYVLDPLGEKVQEGLERLLAAFQRAHAIWSVRTEHNHGDWKRNAGAGTSVGRRRVSVQWGAPPIVRTNARVGSLDLEGTRLYFFPDRLLIFGRGGVRAAPYADLDMRAGLVRFIEDGQVPRDARLLGTTWRFVNKDGGPDRRFANNCQLPVVSYGTLELSSPSGLRLSLQTSTEGLAAGVADLLRTIQAAIRDLESREANGLRSFTPSPFEDDPPPLLQPARALIRSARIALSFRWLAGLPGWAVPVAWGLIFSMPLVAILARLMGPGGWGSDLFLLGAVIVAGGAAISLSIEHFRGRRARLEEESAGRRSRFRALLAGELRSRPPARFDFAALVADGGLPRAEADLVADEVFRKYADRVVADGVITAAERSKLDALARILEMDVPRAARIEGDAKEEIYRRTVAEALADGVVTEEEAQTLNELRENLGVSDSNWAAGDIVT